MSTRSNTSLTPMYGLGSQNRVVGAIFASCPRTRIGSARRIYDNLKNDPKVGAFAAMKYMRDVSGLGPYVIQNNKLVWN